MVANSRFFKKNLPLTLQQILDLCEGRIESNSSLDYQAIIDDIASLEEAKSNHLSFFNNAKYLKQLKSSKAGFCICHKKYSNYAPSSMIVIEHPNPYKAYALIANKYYQENIHKSYISPSSHIAKSAQIGDNCYIGHNVIIEDNVVIGDNNYIDHNSIIKKNVILGSGCTIQGNVTIAYAIIGNNVSIHSGAKIGQEGFGFASDHIGHYRVPQLGLVKIGNNVEIGANTTIDRGSSSDTEIDDMCQIDNLVQIGHNVKLGKACVVVAQVGIAGSTKVGNFCIFGGQVGIAGHLHIGDQVQIAAQSGVVQDLTTKQIVGGSPCVPIRQWHRQNFTLKKISQNSNKINTNSEGVSDE